MQNGGKLEQYISILTSWFPKKDPIFSGVKRENPGGLDKYQMEALYSPAMRNIVLAGAGGGKTKVLTNRVAFLLNHGVDLNRIRVITFTKATTKELKERLHSLTGIPEEKLDGSVSTIHKLAMRALAEVSPYEYLIADMNLPHDRVRSAWETVVNEEVQRDPRLAVLLAETIGAKERDYDVYDLYLKQNIHPEPTVYTSSGVVVRSKMEQKVADFLFARGIPFKYEWPVLFAEVVFRPDFYLPEVDAYVEVLGLWDHPDHIEKYRQDFEFKKNMMKSWGYHYAYLELHPDDMASGRFGNKIEEFVTRLKRLSKRVLNKWERKIERTQSDAQSRCVNLFYKIDNSLTNNEMATDKYAAGLKSPYDLLVPYYFRFRQKVLAALLDEQYLADSHMFAYLAENLPDGFGKDIEYVFIDEFQDVQPLQMSFLQHFLKNKFYVIGDARQSIYSFLGGSTYFIDNLSKHFRNVRKVHLRNNYRSQRNIVELGNMYARDFPRIEAHQKEAALVTVIVVENESQQAEQTYRWLKGRIKDERLMVLGRFEKSQEKTGKVSEAYQRLAKQHGDTYYTFHGSKGREDDHVLVINCNFWPDKDIWETLPGKPLDHPMIAVIQNDYQVRDQMKDERRLFYVALTRAKQSLFLVTQKGIESPLVTELKDAKNVEWVTLEREKPRQDAASEG